MVQSRRVAIVGKPLRTLLLVVLVAAGFVLGAGVAFAGCALVLGVAARVGDSDVSTGVGLGALAGGIAGAGLVWVVARALLKKTPAESVEKPLEDE